MNTIYQFVAVNYVQQPNRIIDYGYRSRQRPIIPHMIRRHVPLLPVAYDCQEETAIIEGTYIYPPIRSTTYTRHPMQENFEHEEQIGRVDSRFSDETLIIGEGSDYRQNGSDLDNQPTYEENLELEEQMGRVGSRLSEETIMRHLKIRSYDATSKRMDEEAEICVICQGEYEKDEFIGGLECRHEYHVECIKKWLQQHNSCPICKAAAVSPNAAY